MNERMFIIKIADAIRETRDAMSKLPWHVDCLHPEVQPVFETVDNLQKLVDEFVSTPDDTEMDNIPERDRCKGTDCDAICGRGHSQACEDEHDALTFGPLESTLTEEQQKLDAAIKKLPPIDPYTKSHIPAAVLGSNLHSTIQNVLKDQGYRANSGKPKLSMVLEARKALEGAAMVLMFGEQKYARSDWKKGLDLNECMDSLMRHATKYMDGEYLDLNPETGLADEGYSGLPHLDHLLVNALFLAHHTNRDTCDGRLAEVQYDQNEGWDIPEEELDKYGVEVPEEEFRKLTQEEYSESQGYGTKPFSSED